MTENYFPALDAQCAESAFAKLTPEESNEFDAWCEARATDAMRAMETDCLAARINCADAQAAEMEQAQRQCDRDDLRREFRGR